MQFRRIYWLLLALAFFVLALLNIYVVDFTQYAAFFNLIAAFLFFALFFLTKRRPSEGNSLDKNKGNEKKL